ncbi:MAG TPA: inositol monophosphatase family protein [Candidatus Woesebacteria bacterium]|nr:inositol monophosphatase family protein [Candidatus Woesebacteria bacterium]HNS94488.1 inositol monophosphatase family protein [Candidatus Woesebacteria bacterium]
MAFQLDLVKDAALSAVVAVGDYVAKSQDHIGELKMKGVKNPQTDIDVQAEVMLRQKLSAILPGAGFIVEEGETIKSAQYNWVIDPIDGTKFFSTHYPVYFTQIALMEADAVIFAAIYTPVSKQLFWAGKGMGAFLNSQKMTVHYDGPLAQSLVGLEIGKLPANGPHIAFAQKIASGVNRLMMVSTLLAPYLLTNTIQAYIRYYNGPNHLYDIAPRFLLHEEAGAVVRHHLLNGYDLYICAHPNLAQEIEEFLSV